MIARDLSTHIWNAIADLVARSRSPREIYFAKVTRSDPKKNLVWVKDFGEKAIPLVAHTFGFAYYDTVPIGNASEGQPIQKERQRREDKTNKNPNFKTHLICPRKGDLVVILDPWGAKRLPVCIGVIQSSKGFWEGD